MKSSGKAILGQEGSANRSCHAGTATSKNAAAVMAAEMRIALRARRRIRSFQQITSSTAKPPGNWPRNTSMPARYYEDCSR